MTDAEPAYGMDAVELVGPWNELGMIGKYAGEFDKAEWVYGRAMQICNTGRPVVSSVCRQSNHRASAA